MKIIHCADLHLDAKMTSNLSKEQARERKGELLHTFSRMVDYARKQQVSVILIAGDMFDTRNISATARNLVTDCIRNNPEIDFLYLKGNHDNDNFLSNMEEVPQNLKLFSEEWTVYRYGKVAIWGLELSESNNPTAYNSLVLDYDDCNIVTLHGQIGKYAAKDKAESIDLGKLKNKNIDYLALGHVHGYQREELDARGIYCYSGCLEGRGFDECREKGFVLLEVDETTGKCKDTFVPFAARTLYTVPVDCTGAGNTSQVKERVEDELMKRALSPKSLVKIELTGAVDVETEIHEEYLLDCFCERFYYVKIKNHTTYQIDYTDYEKDESLKGAFIRMIQKSDMDSDTKSRVIRMGIQALSGEEF